MTNKIVLKYRFTFHQKLMILIVIALFWAVMLALLLQIFTSNKEIYSLIFWLSYPGFIILAFTKKGFLVNDRKLFRASFFLGFPLDKKTIDIQKSPKLSVLTFKKSRKLPWFSIARPDAAKDYNSFEINILNDIHTHREVIIELKKQKNVKLTLDFLTTHTYLVYEKYNPKTRRRPRRKR